MMGKVCMYYGGKKHGKQQQNAKKKGAQCQKGSLSHKGVGNKPHQHAAYKQQKETMLSHHSLTCASV